jgi:DNA-binding SARP family transcriptional activator/tetratricopeptide (TPR) repeat protein
LSVKFKILGSLEISEGADQVDLPGPRQQVVVATLLLSANRVVTIDRLVEATYGEDPPPTARSQVQNSISSLRRRFASHASNETISTREYGYVIHVNGGHLDAEMFQQLVAAAHGAANTGQPDQAVSLYHDALSLWRGDALDGIDSQLVRVAAIGLNEQHIATNEDRLELELDLGRHHELISQLIELIHEFPLRQRLRGMLMLALYRCDRAAEALEVYRQARGVMIEELGIEPGERLQHLEQAILAADPALSAPVGSMRIRPAQQQAPNTLPADIADFTGREDQITQIRQHLVQAVSEDRRPVPIVIVVGKGGVGKTSLAVHVSHRMADRFPDGMLFADLHGGTSHVVNPAQVLERFLRALGTPASQIPEGFDERAEVYRNLVANRQILVVLDDALSESQVSPLLPSSGTAGVLVTSRRRLTGMAGAMHIQLDVLDVSKSVELLARITGRTRVQAEHEAATAVARHCGHLPLALRIAGARLSARPHWSIEQFVERLANESQRLDELRHGDMGIRPSIMLTYQSVTAQARQLFRRLALLDSPVFSGWIGAALLDKPITEAEDILDELVSTQLIESTDGNFGVHSQYRFHELIRVFARERLIAEEAAAARTATLERALGALLHLAEMAHIRYFGGDYVRIRSDAFRWPLPDRMVEQLIRDPLAWYELERTTLVCGVKQAAQAGLVELSWGLASSTVALFESRIYLDDWRETHEIALEATSKAHHIRGQAAMLDSIASLHITQQRFEPARRDLTQAVQLFEEAHDEQGVALATRHIAHLDRLGGRLDEATRRYEQALATFRRLGDHIAIAHVLHGLAEVRLELAQFDSAKELLSEALQLCQIAKCTRIEAQVLYRQGEACLLSAELADAIGKFELSLALSKDISDIVGEAYALQGIGIARVRQSELEQARNALERAREFAVIASEQLVEARAILGLSELALVSKDPSQAVVFGLQASRMFRSMGVLLYDVQVHTLLCDAYTELGDFRAVAETEALRRNQI